MKVSDRRRVSGLVEALLVMNHAQYEPNGLGFSSTWECGVVFVNFEDHRYKVFERIARSYGRYVVMFDPEGKRERPRPLLALMPDGTLEPVPRTLDRDNAVETYVSAIGARRFVGRGFHVQMAESLLDVTKRSAWFQRHLDVWKIRAPRTAEEKLARWNPHDDLEKRGSET